LAAWAYPNTVFRPQQLIAGSASEMPAASKDDPIFGSRRIKWEFFFNIHTFTKYINIC